MLSRIFGIANLVRITKLPHSFLIAISALLGLALASETASLRQYLTLFLGTFLVVSAGAMLNNVHDRDIDAIMERTRLRPIPTGVYSPRAVRVVALLIMHGGFMVLNTLPHGIAVALLSGAGLFLYNFVYTPLKRRNVFAIVPGAACGVAPPVMGWISGNGSLLTPPFAALLATVFLWQLLHFVLIHMLRHKDYSKAGLPNILDHFSENALKAGLWGGLLLFILLLGLAALFHDFSFVSTRVFVLFNALALATSTLYSIFRTSNSGRWRLLFHHLNATLGVVTLAMILERS
jgi:protoheme IX farnesyltransferase